MERKWKTKIGDSTEEQTIVRGYDLMELIGKLSFSEMIFLELKGVLPTKEEKEMLDAIFVSTVEHGIAVPSIISARTILSAGNPLNAAVAAGILAIGDSHGGAIEQAAKTFQENISKSASEIVKSFKEQEKRISGFGHKIYTIDPRTIKLKEIAEKNKIAGNHLKLAFEIEKELEKSSGRKLCLNVDGAVGAIISDMGFDWRIGKGFFIIPRTVGIVAHAQEEMDDQKSFRRLSSEEYEYYGEKNKKLK